MSSQPTRTTKIKERAVSELKKFAAIAFYLWILFSLFEIHRYAVLRELNIHSLSGFKIGFAAVNALIMGKVILIGEALHVGEQLREKRLSIPCCSSRLRLPCWWYASTSSKTSLSASFTVNLSWRAFRNWEVEGWKAWFSSGIMAFVVLIPFFFFTELQKAVGSEKLQSLILHERSKADAA